MRAYSDEERKRYQAEERERNEGYRESDLDRAGRAMTGYSGSARRQEDTGWTGDLRRDIAGPFAGMGPRSYRRSEESIRDDICDRLSRHGQIDARDIDVEVREGEAILKGRVNTRDEKRLAEDVAESVSGVRDVQNQLRVSGYQERSQWGVGEGGRWQGRESGRETRKVGGARLSVFGIFRDRPAVERVVDTLKAAGFRSTDISVLFPQTEGTKDFAFEKGTKAPEGATTGAGSGMVVGGALGWLVGIGALAIPGIGPLVAAGPIAAALAGMGVGGAVGGITGALIGMGMPEYEAKRYEGRVKSGHILISVHSDDREWANRAEGILDQAGAYDISRSKEKSADYAESDRPMPRSSV